jgi:hypothetical protein
VSYAPLVGASFNRDKLVRLVYVDETGIANILHDPHTVVAGIIVHADTQLIGLESDLDSLVEKHIPEGFREGFVFHAKDIFNGSGKGYFNRKSEKWPMLDERWAIADDLAGLVAKYQLPVAYGSVERSKIPPDILESFASINWNEPLGAHGMAFAVCAFRIEQWMRAKTQNEVCMLVVEDTESGRSMIRNLQKHYQKPGAERAVADMGLKFNVLPLRSIRHDPLFEGKRPSSVLQLADFCAFLIKRILSGDQRVLRFLKPIRHLVVDGMVE